MAGRREQARSAKAQRWASRSRSRSTTRAADGPDPRAAALRRSIELLWGVEAPRPARGPKPALTIDAIVGASLALADREGLAALSMARIARELGFTTMSLYRYVQSKDELLMLITDAALGSPPPMDDLDGDWRSGLDRWARACRAAFEAHPWALQVPISGPPVSPNNVGWLDAGLQALEATGLTEQEKASCVLLISGFVRNEAILVRDLSSGDDPQIDHGDVDGAARPTYGDALRLVVTEDRFPALFRTIESGAFDDEGEYGDDDFEFGLTRVLDGVAVLVDRRRPRRSRAR